MKNVRIPLLLASVLALPVWAADETEQVGKAIQKLSEQPNYSWTAKVETPRRAEDGNREGGQGRQGRGGRGGGFRGGMFQPPSGKTEKDGFTVFNFPRGSNTTEVVVKGDKVALKDGEEWKTAEEMAEGDGSEEGGGQFRAQFMARRAQQAKLPTKEAQEVLGRVKSLKKDGDAYAGELTAEGIKQMFTMARRGGRGPGGQERPEGNRERPAPDTSGVTGTAKFWVKDGVLAKYETHVTGKMPFGGGRDGGAGREMDVTRTTTVEIQDIGSTKVPVAAEARKKLK